MVKSEEIVAGGLPTIELDGEVILNIACHYDQDKLIRVRDTTVRGTYIKHKQRRRRDR